MNQAIEFNHFFNNKTPFEQLPWHGSQDQLTNHAEKISVLINELEKPLWAVKAGSQVFLTDQDGFSGSGIWKPSSSRTVGLCSTHAVGIPG